MRACGRALAHVHRDVGGHHPGSEAPRDLDRGGADPAADVENLVARGQLSLAEELLGGLAAARVYDPLAEQPEQQVGVRRRDRRPLLHHLRHLLWVPAILTPGWLIVKKSI